MKKMIFMVGVCSAVLWSGCADDTLTNAGVRPVSGNEVQFGAGTGHFVIDPQQKNRDADTRTVYIAKGEQNFANYTALSVNWEDGDQVRIYCPQAEAGYRTADYKVERKPNNDSALQTYESGFLVKVEDTGIRWGDQNEEHKFYSFYPTTTGGNYTLEGLTTDTKITAEIPVAQEHGTLYTYSSESGQPDPNGDWKIIAPDMTFAMMVGEGTYNPSDTKFDGVIDLKFTPIVTVLDVLVNGPKDDTQADFKVIQVMVWSNEQPIVGKFTYDFETKEYSGWPEDSGTEDLDYTLASIDCMYNGEPLSLGAGEKLNVKFFLLPRDIKAGELTVAVFLEGGQVMYKKLGNLNNQENSVLSNIDLVQGKIIKVRTPYLTVGDANNWMYLIADDTYFASQLSLPGSKHSYTYNTFDDEALIDRETKYMQSFQKLSIKDQFNQGIRAFDVKVNADRGEAYIYAGGKNLSMTLGNMLDTLKVLVAPDNKEHTEAAVVSINYVYGLSTSGGTWYSNVNRAIQTWHDRNPEVLKIVTSETTMGEMRGKIAILLNCPDNSGLEVPDIPVGAINGYSSSVRNTTLNELSFAGDRTARIWIQNLYQVNNPEITSGEEGYAYGKDGLLPMYATDPESHLSGDLVGLKIALSQQLFNQSRTNNSLSGLDKLKNLYINDLGGFCVVKDINSTGYVKAQAYAYTIGWREAIMNPFSKNYLDYAKIPAEGEGDAYGYQFYGYEQPTGASSLDRWFRLEDHSDMGQGGNTALFAQEINPKVNTLIYNLVNEGRTPLGIVYMNFAGINEVFIGGKTYNVQGQNLPSLIMSNNFKFPLVTKSGASSTRNK